MTKGPAKSGMIRKQRCAIYTRKSSEEGLEQEFNSLHAQREACEAYVLSQAGEGWTTLRRRAPLVQAATATGVPAAAFAWGSSGLTVTSQVAPASRSCFSISPGV